MPGQRSNHGADSLFIGIFVGTTQLSTKCIPTGGCMALAAGAAATHAAILSLWMISADLVALIEPALPAWH